MSLLARIPAAAAALPVAAVLEELDAALQGHAAAVLAAPPGSGKTTLVPLALLNSPWLCGRSILILEPRRLAARAAAARMAALLGQAVGDTVGYRVRFDHQVGARTRIEVLTEGILTRRLQADPALEGVGLVIFDELHERSLHADLALALCLDAASGLREDLRLLAMSATLDTQAVSALMGGAPVVTGQGRSHPVSVHYAPLAAGFDAPGAVAAAVRRVLAEHPGDVLGFLPGGREIRAARQALAGLEEAGVQVHALYGDLGRGAQDRALSPAPPGQRRVVLATPIAETSLTIEGIATVVDSGWMRTPRFDPNTGLTRLETVRISQASAEQRAGRAGRLGPGRCYRLWSETVQQGLAPRAQPQILAADLAALALELACWGVSDPAQLRWLDPPPAGAYAQARDLLQALDAVDEKGRVTDLGRRMAGLPLHPRLAHMLLSAPEPAQARLACDLAALLSERDLLAPRGAGASADVEERLRVLQAWREGRREAGVQAAACAGVERAATQIRRLLGLAPGRRASAALAGPLLARAYPERVAQRRPGQDGRYRLAVGRGARLAPEDPLGASPWLAVAHLDAGRAEGRIYLAAAVQEQDLRQVHAAHLRTREVVAWDAEAGAVSARGEEILGSLVLSSRPLDRPDPEALAAALRQGLRRAGPGALPWTEAARAWQARVQSLRHWRPREDWPAVDDQSLMDTLAQWLEPYLEALTRLEQVRRLDLARILAERLDWNARQRLDEAAPTHLQVPSGSRLRLRYTPGEPPVLAVRLQEMFGLARTPRVCWGEVPVMLHLLSPAGRPIQITQDLAGFWERTYAQVRREFKGRYPKHHWPEDPWSAVPTARTRPR